MKLIQTKGTCGNKKEDAYNDEYYFKILNKSRYILLYDDINNCAADMIVSKIKAMNSLNHHPITIEINSNGGDISAGIAIINAMKNSKSPIHTIISGEACSMAAMISVVGTRRKMYANSFWMQHPLSSGQADYLQFIKDRTLFLTNLENIMTDILKKHTHLTKLDLHKIEAGEIWLTAKQALEKGVIDEIL